MERKEFSHKEKYIQQAVASAFKKNNISFEKEVKTDLKFKNDKIGVYFLDFLVEGKVVLEIKRKNYFSKHDIEQVYAYLKATGLKLGIIAHFTRKGVEFKRILNLE